jgi:tRNA-dihydrouridine synthase
VPVVGNGDVRTPSDVLAMLRETGCAGVMIGRGAFAMPWIFRLAWAAQTGGAAEEPSEREKLGIVRRYFERMREYRGDAYALHKIRQKISWLGKGINGSHCRVLKDAVRAASTPAEIHSAIDSWEERADLAPAELALGA